MRCEVWKAVYIHGTALFHPAPTNASARIILRLCCTCRLLLLSPQMSVFGNEGVGRLHSRRTIATLFPLRRTCCRCVFCTPAAVVTLRHTTKTCPRSVVAATKETACMGVKGTCTHVYKRISIVSMPSSCTLHACAHPDSSTVSVHIYLYIPKISTYYSVTSSSSMFT